MSHFTCPTCTTPHQIFGSLDSFHDAAKSLSLDILGQLPMVPAVSKDGDGGAPTLLRSDSSDNGVREVKKVMDNAASRVWSRISPASSNA